MTLVMKLKNNKIFNAIVPILVLTIVSILVVLPFGLSTSFNAHDLYYHVGVIRSVNNAWQNGSFGSKVYGIICQDYGYGNGIFYSMIPVSLCVIFMNVLNLSCTQALSLEFFLIFILSALATYFFVKRVFKSNWVALISACAYIAFPYMFTDLYVRFAFSEMFIILALPLIAFGLYELIENGNYKAFIPLFTIGYSLAILTHLSSTIYITIIALIYIIVRFKKFISNYKFVPFLISCFLILLISATFYIPMALNYGVTQTEQMSYGGFALWDSALCIFEHPYLIPSTILTVALYIIFCAIYFNKQKDLREDGEKLLFKMSTIALIMISPLFPWFLIWGPLAMLQFAWRLYIIVALFDVLILSYILKSLNSRLFFTSIVIGVFIVSSCSLCVSVLSLHKNGTGFNVNTAINYDSYISSISGTGAFRKDYHPKNAENDYIYARANDSMILNSTVDILHFANYQNNNLLSFEINGSKDSQTTLNIPYSVCSDIAVSQISKVYPYETQTTEITYETIDGTAFLKLVLTDFESPQRVLISYPENSDFDKHLKSNPFEFVVLEGNATFSNFEKEQVSKYSVEIIAAEETRIELPTLFYNGYKLTYTTANGTYNLEPIHGENGFVEVVVSESGTLNVSFEAGYLTFANVVSIVGLALFAIVLLACLIIPRKYFTRTADWITNFFKTHKTASEILRFLIVGGIATVIDIITMGLVMYLMEKNLYPSMINIFINSPTPSTLATIVGTSAGFIAGLVVNYVLSILFVFNEKGKSKSAQGFLVFTALSLIGLGINILGTYIGFDLLNINQWIVKIVMIVIVLVYNYISKKLILFKNKKPAEVITDSKNEKSEDTH